MVPKSYLASPAPCQTIQRGLGSGVCGNVTTSSLGVGRANIDNPTARWHVDNSVVDHVKSAEDVEFEGLCQFFYIGLLSDGAEVCNACVVHYCVRG